MNIYSSDSTRAHPTQALSPQTNAAELPLRVCDELGCGVIVSDAHGAVRMLNSAARLELAAGALLKLVDGRVQCPREVGGDLHSAIVQAAQRGRRSLVRLDRGDDRLLVSVVPLQLQSVDRPLVMLMLGRRRPCSDLDLELLARSYGLTSAERRVLAALIRENTPREIAAGHGVALSTVRTQIQSLRAKLGARNIDGVLLRAAEVPPMASALRLAASPLAA